MYEKKSDFGRCPICDAITSLDPNVNQYCDRCYVESGKKEVVDQYVEMFKRKAE